jgi:cell division protease FtsH
MIPQFDFRKFMIAVDEGKINPDKVTIHIDTSEFVGEVKPEFEKEFDGLQFSFVGNPGDQVYQDLRKKGITPKYERGDSNNLFMSFISNWLPMLLVAGLLFFVIRQYCYFI